MACNKNTGNEAIYKARIKDLKERIDELEEELEKCKKKEVE